VAAGLNLACRLVHSAARRSVRLKSLPTNNSGTCSRWARAQEKQYLKLSALGWHPPDSDHRPPWRRISVRVGAPVLANSQKGSASLAGSSGKATAITNITSSQLAAPAAIAASP